MYSRSVSGPNITASHSNVTKIILVLDGKQDWMLVAYTDWHVLPSYPKTIIRFCDDFFCN
jgi:hypothetical protein